MSILRVLIRDELSVAESRALPAPDDGVAGEAEGPDGHGNKVPEGEEPKTGQHLVVGKDLGADSHGQREAEEEAQSKEPQAERAEAAGDHIEHGPGKAVGEDEPGIAPGARVADGA